MTDYFFSCQYCFDFLYEPITLPCGNSVCKRCFGKVLKKESLAFACPAKNCKEKHLCRNEKVDILLSQLAEKSFPLATRAMALAKEAEFKLKKWWNLDVCPAEIMDCCSTTSSNSMDRKRKVDLTSLEQITQPSNVDLHLKAAELLEIIQNYINPAIQLAPHVQLLYLLRAKALVEVGCFDFALQDVREAHLKQPDNRRGMIGERLVQWKKKEYEQKGLVMPDVSRELHFILQKMLVQPKEVARNLGHGDFECMLCLNTLSTPMTSPCGHTWCRKCLLTSIDHSRHCPLCRCPLPTSDYFANRSVNKAIQGLVSVHAPDSLHSSKEDLEHNSTDCRVLKNVPIFLCSLIFPGSKQKFHIFEPRYRVLVKRALESNKRFGICLPGTEPGTFMPFGTLVEITQTHSIPVTEQVPTVEGPLPRFLVQTKGLFRFQIKESRLDPTGYFVADIERKLDIQPDDEWSLPNPIHTPNSFSSHVLKTKSFVNCILSTLGEQELSQLQSENGTLPENPVDIPFWIADLLPMDPYTVYKLLVLDSVNERFKLICEWIEGLCCESK